MQPTPWQVLCNIQFFETLLVQAGEKDVQARLASLHLLLIDWNRTVGWLKIFSRELREAQQTPYSGKNIHTPLAVQIKRMKKSSASRTYIVIHYRQRAQRLERKIRGKISAWPLLNYDSAVLKKEYDNVENRRRLAKKQRRQNSG